MLFKKYIARYKKLTLWNRIGFWSSIATFVGLLITLIQFTPNLIDQSNPLQIKFEAHEEDGVIVNFDSTKSPEEYLKSKNYIPLSVYMEVTASSQKADEEIHLSPFLLIQQVEAVPLPKNIAVFEVTGKGDGGANRQCLALLDPSQTKFSAAPMLNSDLSEIHFSSQYDYFKLKGLETEVFDVLVYASPGYKYAFRVGVLYEYKGKQHTIWSSQLYHIAVPEGIIDVYLFEDSAKFQQLIQKQENHYTKEQISALMEKARQHVTRWHFYQVPKLENELH